MLSFVVWEVDRPNLVQEEQIVSSSVRTGSKKDKYDG